MVLVSPVICSVNARCWFLHLSDYLSHLLNPVAFLKAWWWYYPHSLTKPLIKKKKKTKQKNYYSFIVSWLEWLFPLGFHCFCVKEDISNICLMLSGSHFDSPSLFWQSPSWDSLLLGLYSWAPITLLVISSYPTPLWWTTKKGRSFSSTKEEMEQ